MPNHWCVNFDLESKACLQHGIENDLWMMQYQYADDDGNDFQDASRTTRNWRRLGEIQIGDKFVAYLKGNKFFAVGTVIAPRRAKTTHDLKDEIEEYIARKKSHERKSGFVYYTPVFYENLSDKWRHPNWDLMRYPQRIDVDEWRYYVPEGVSVKGLNKTQPYELQMAAFRITKGLFDRIEKRLASEHDKLQRRINDSVSHAKGRLKKNIGKFDGVTVKHVQKALKDIDNGIVTPFREATGYHLIANGKRYSPKEVLGLAYGHKHNTTLKPSEFSGGESPGQANFVLRNLGYTIKGIVTPSRTSKKLNAISAKLKNEGYFDPENSTDDRERQFREIVQRRGQPQFRKKLLQVYNQKCAVTGCDLAEALEAAHISRYQGNDSNHVTNGVLLRADIHTLFDLHLIGIEPKSRKIQIADALTGSSYGELHGRVLNEPEDLNLRPSLAALEIRWKSFQ